MNRASSYWCRARPRVRALVHACLGGAAAALALAAVGAPSASAVIVSLPGGEALSYQPLRGSSLAAGPFDVAFTNLDYNGGPVMPSNTDYALYWQPAGSPVYPSDYQSGLNRYFEDLAHDSGGTQNVDSVSAQYNDSEGRFASYSSLFGGALIDTDPYPANGCTKAPICLTDAQIQAELKRFIAAHALPHDLEHEYFVLTPPGVEDCFTAGGSECSAGAENGVYCAYHGDVQLSEGVIVYANDPYVTGNLGCDEPENHPNGTSDGALIGGLSHEHNESITDPEPNSAWTDIGASTGEVGDKCNTSNGAPLGRAPDGANYNQVVDGHLYWYQEEWSNQGHQCLQRLSFAGEEPVASFTSSRGSGNAVTFDAGASTAPGGVYRYNWQFNDGPGGSLSTPTETSSATVTHTFPAAGVYRVALTVFASDGTSIGTASAVPAGAATAPSVTKVSPAKGTGSGSVTITGTNFIGATSVAFGSVASPSFTVLSPTKIVAAVPAQIAGVVDVRVTGPGGTSAIVTADHYKYLPAVNGVSPASGSHTGGTQVTISGSGFALGAGVTVFKFGTAKATGVSCSSNTTCTATTPAHAAGTVDVKAVVNGVASAKATGDTFTFN